MCTYLHIDLKPQEINTPKCSLWLPLADSIREELSSFVTFVIVTIKKKIKIGDFPSLVLFAFKCTGERRKNFQNAT